MGMMWNKSEMATIRGNVQAPSTGTLKAASKVEAGSSGTAISISPEQVKQKNTQINSGVTDFIKDVKKSLAADPSKPISKNLEVLNGNYKVDYNPKTGDLTVTFDGKSKEYGGSTNFAREIAQEATEKITGHTYSPDKNRANGNTAVFIAENPSDPRSLKTQLKVINGGPALKDDFENKGIKGITSEILNDLKSPNTEKRNTALSSIYKSIVDAFPNDKTKADNVMNELVKKYIEMNDDGNKEVKGEKVIAIKLKPDQIKPDENNKPSITGARPNIGTSGVNGYENINNKGKLPEGPKWVTADYYLPDHPEDKSGGLPRLGNSNTAYVIKNSKGTEYVAVWLKGGPDNPESKYVMVPEAQIRDMAKRDGKALADGSKLAEDISARLQSGKMNGLIEVSRGEFSSFYNNHLSSSQLDTNADRMDKLLIAGKLSKAGFNHKPMSLSEIRSLMYDKATETMGGGTGVGLTKDQIIDSIKGDKISKAQKESLIKELAEKVTYLEGRTQLDSEMMFWKDLIDAFPKGTFSNAKTGA